VAVVLVGVLAGCGAGEPTTGRGDTPAAQSSTAAATTSVPAGVRRAATVYAAAIRHHLTTVTEPIPPVVYVLAQAVPDAANSMRRFDDEDGVAIDPQTRQLLITELADLAAVSFITSKRTVLDAEQRCPAVTNHGVVLTLAPVPPSGDRVELGLADFRACLNARWQTYVLARTTTGWTVQGTTGPVVIS
jgi:hypothetical protein